MNALDWFTILDGEMGTVAEVLRASPQDDLVPLELATWRERVKRNRVVTDEAAEVAARAAVNVIAAAIEMDAGTRLKLFLHICSHVKLGQ